MKILFSFVFLTIFVTTIHVENCIAQWTRTNGPNSGTVFCMDTAGTKLFCGTVTGLFVSTNNGNSWKPDVKYDVRKILSYNGDVFLATANGVLRSTNAGNNWTMTNSGMTNTNVNDIKSYGQYVFAATSGGAFLTTNSGMNWVPVNNGLTTLSINSLAFLGSCVVASTYDLIFMSTNYGQNWVQAGPGITNYHFRCLTSYGSKLFAGTGGTYSGGRVYSSEDTGKTWNYMYGNIPDIIINSLVISSSTLYACAGSSYGPGGIYATDVNSVNWWSCGSRLPQNRVLCFLNLGSRMFAGVDSKGIQMTTNNGNNWNSVGLGVCRVWTLAYSGSNLFSSAYESGIYMSSDYGSNWYLKDSSLNSQLVYLVASYGPKLFAGTSTQLYVSTNNAVSWSPAGINAYIWSIAFSGNYVYVGTGGYGVYVSGNSGTSWTQMNSGLGSLLVNAISVVGNTVYAGTNSGVFKSTDNGMNWISANNGLSNLFIRSFAGNETSVFAGSIGLYKSTDGGGNWQSAGLQGHLLTSLLISGNYLFAGTESSIYYSPDFGVNWFEKNQGFDSSYSVMSLTVFNNYLYAGTEYASVWKRPLSEVIGIINLSSEIPGSLGLSQNCPNPFNPVTQIKFDIPKISFVNISVFDISGREVEVLVSQNMQPGIYQTTWNASKYSSGIYFCRLQAGEFSQTRKMLLVK